MKLVNLMFCEKFVAVMSDDEDEVTYTRRTKTIHYGSLEEQDRQTLIEADEHETTKPSAGDGDEDQEVDGMRLC